MLQNVGDGGVPQHIRSHLIFYISCFPCILLFAKLSAVCSAQNVCLGIRQGDQSLLQYLLRFRHCDKYKRNGNKLLKFLQRLLSYVYVYRTWDYKCTFAQAKILECRVFDPPTFCVMLLNIPQSKHFKFVSDDQQTFEF